MALHVVVLYYDNNVIKCNKTKLKGEKHGTEKNN